MLERPLGRKAYFKIAHLPGSRTGSSDRTAPRELAERCLVAAPPRRGRCSCRRSSTAPASRSARLDGAVLALGREGTLAAHSQNPGRQMFAAWVEQRAATFTIYSATASGSWANGSRSLMFDSLRAPPRSLRRLRRLSRRAAVDVRRDRRATARGLPRPSLLHRGGALRIAAMLEMLGGGGHGAVEPPEGAVWRVERAGRVVGMAKYVRGDKVDGALLPENSGREAVWNFKL